MSALSDEIARAGAVVRVEQQRCHISERSVGDLRRRVIRRSQLIVALCVLVSADLDTGSYQGLFRLDHETQVARGGTIHVVGSCRFRGVAQRSVVVIFGIGPGSPQAEVTGDERGNFSAQLAVPLSAPLGEHELVVSCGGATDVVYNVDQTKRFVEVVAEPAAEPPPVLDWIAKIDGGSLIYAYGARSDTARVLHGDAISGAGRCFSGGGPEPTYRLYLIAAGTGVATLVATESITDPAGAVTVAVSVTAGQLFGSYYLAVTCGYNDCADSFRCTGPFFALEIVDPSTTTTSSTTTSSTTTTKPKGITTTQGGKGSFTG